MTTSSDPRNPIEILAEEFLDRKRRGEMPTLREYLERYPDLADEIRDLFPALLMMEDLGQDSSGTTGSPNADDAGTIGARLQKLGDYRILREIGRGGMGIVYEAEQESLGRRVALKVLSASALVDTNQVRRFEREARAAARLHHTSIVPVFGVGQQDGHHYYVMQFIAGLGLDLVLQDLRRLRHSRAGAKSAEVPEPEAPYSHEPSARMAERRRIGLTAADVARSLITGRDAWGGSTPIAASPTESFESAGATTPPTIGAGAESSPVVLPRSSELSALSDSDRRYYLSVARIGTQVAEALDYANRQGVLHRDVKPSNLLLDDRGNVWVADFGLAKTAEADDLTHTGDILGTIRYMAPERFEGQCDARADVYGLGLTLYELVALRPAYQAADRHTLIERVLHEEPARLKKLAPTVPRDLETIIAKATARDPATRYATAGELGEDLRRFMEDRPIRARRSGPLERAWRWCRRNKALASLEAALFVALLAGTAIATYYAVRAREGERRALANARRADERAELLRRQDYIGRVNLAYRECLDGNVARALGLLGGCPEDLRGWEWFYAERQCHLDLRTFESGGQSVNGVAFSPDGTRVASVSGTFEFDEPSLTGDLVVRDVASGQEILGHRGVPSGFRGLAFSPDGRWIAAGNASDLVIWDAATGTEQLRLADPGDPKLTLLSLAYSPDGRRIIAAYGSADYTMVIGHGRLWDAATGEELGDKIPGHPGRGILGVAFSPDGREVAVASGALVEVWGLDTRNRVRSFRGHTGYVRAVAFSPDGRYLATGGAGQTVRLWDRANGNEIRALYAHTSSVLALAFSPDSQWLISASGDKSLKLWEVASGRPLTTFHGHLDRVGCVAFSPNGLYFASGGADHALKLWNATSSPQLTFMGHDGWIFALAFSPDGRCVASGASNFSTRDNLMLWDATSGVRSATFAKGCPQVSSVAFRWDGRRLATACRDGTVRIWNADAGGLVRTLPRQSNVVATVAYSPDGRYLASATTDIFNPRAYDREHGEVKLWDADTGREIRTLGGHTAGVFDVAFSPDGRYLASACADRIVRIWDTTDLSRKARALRGHSGHVRRVVFLPPDGHRLATAGGILFTPGGEVKIWDLATGQVLHDLRGHTARVRGMASSPDGRRLATGSDDRTMKIWDTTTGQEVFTLRGHADAVLSVAYSPDGRRIVTGGNDLSAIVWDTRRPAADTLLRREAESRVKVPELPGDPFAP